MVVVHICVGECAHVFICVLRLEVNNGCIPQLFSALYLLKPCLLLNLEYTDCLELLINGPQGSEDLCILIVFRLLLLTSSPGILELLVYTAAPEFYVGAEDTNLHPNACTVSTLQTELSLEPPEYLLNEIKLESKVIK